LRDRRTYVETGKRSKGKEVIMQDIDDLLRKTSRTFALTIPLLPEPTRKEVGVAYLLFRIIDTFEDAPRWAPLRRVEALQRFIDLLDAPPQTAAPPCKRRPAARFAVT
jgi:farnesyl-diphosphate farnesyltransferase